MPDTALEYLFKHIPVNGLVLTSESPPWLRKACQERQLNHLDVRVSPLRFGQDAHFALFTNNPIIRSRIAAFQITEEELRLEAALLGSNLRLHRHRLEEQKRYRFDLDNCLVFVGQHPADAALIGPKGQPLRCADFAEQLRMLAQGRRVLHFAAYEDSFEFNLADQQRRELADVFGAPVLPCRQNAYQILSVSDDVELVGISAALLQEACWFDKTVHMLASPLVPLSEFDGSGGTTKENYVLVRFEDLVAPAFWHAILAPTAPPPKLSKLPSLGRHHARETLDVWDEYEKVLTWSRPLASGIFERSGGGLLRQKIRPLEQAYKTALQPSPATRGEGGDDTGLCIKTLKNSKLGQTAYILGNAPSLNELNIEKCLAYESFWCNTAFRLKDAGIDFRPKYYCISDPWVFQQWPHEVLDTQASIKILPRTVWREMAQIAPEALERQNIAIYDLKEDSDDPLGSFMFSNRNNFSYDPSIGVHGGGSVVLIAIQFAFYMGYSRIFVGGVDLDYSGEQTYFHGGQLSTAEAAIMRERVARMQESFIAAKWHCEKNGRTLAKITASPHLPLDYVDLPDLMAESKKHNN